MEKRSADFSKEARHYYNILVAKCLCAQRYDKLQFHIVELIISFNDNVSKLRIQVTKNE